MNTNGDKRLGSLLMVQYPEYAYGPYRKFNPILELYIHLSRTLFVFQLLGDFHCWWTIGVTWSHFFGWLRWFVALWEHQNFPCLKSIKIVIVWVYKTFTFRFSSLRHYLCMEPHLLLYFVWRRITDWVTMAETRIWSILVIQYDFKMVYQTEQKKLFVLAIYMHVLLFLFYNFWKRLSSPFF